jgi:hypothetical protein
MDSHVSAVFRREGATPVLALLCITAALSACGSVTSEPITATNGTPPASSAPAPTSPTGAPVVSFDQPTAGQSITAGQDVAVSGSVSGLNGSALWIVSKPDAGDGKYHLTQSGPVASDDGPWSFTDIEVGDSSDSGEKIIYTALSADNSCSELLAALPPDPNANGLQTFALVPDGCTPLTATVPVSVA